MRSNKLYPSPPSYTASLALRVPSIALLATASWLVALGLADAGESQWALALAVAAVLGMPTMLLWYQLFHRHGLMELAEKRSQLLLQSALGTAQTGAWCIDLTQSSPSMQLSEAAQHIYGYSGGAHLPLAHWLVHPANTLLDAQAVGSPRELFMRMLSEDGNTLDIRYPRYRAGQAKPQWLRDRGTVRRDSRGRAIELVGLVVDITETYYLQDEMYRSSESLRQAMAVSHLGAWGVDFLKDPYALSFSEQAQNILGLSPRADDLYKLHEIRSNRVAAGHPESEALVRKQYEAVHSGASDVFDAVSAYRRPNDQRIIWIRMTGTVKRDTNGELVHLVGVIRDVTQDKEYESHLLAAKEAAESANRAKGDFLANMNHEILTPLNAILGLSNLAQKGVQDAQQKDYLGKIHTAGQHLLDMLSGVLDFSHLESGQFELQNQPFSPDDVLERVVQAVGEKAASKNLELICSMDPRLPRSMLGDCMRIAQVLVHFANNAVKFTEQGEIHLQLEVLDVRTDAVSVQFSVRDTGLGMTREQMGQLFKRFTQADTSMTRRYGGIGMGLAISQKLAEAMGGGLDVQSIYGQGATFSLTLNLQIQSSQTIAWVDLGDLRDRHALVVDDNALAASVVSKALQNMGLQTRHCQTVEQALQAVRSAQSAQEPLDLLFIDTSMPGVEDWSALRALRMLQWDTNSVVLMSPKHRCADLLPEAERLGLRNLISKPVSYIQLALVLRQMSDAMRILPVPESESQLKSRLRALRGARLLLVEDNEINQQIACEMLCDIGMQVDVAENGNIGVERVHTRMADGLPYDLVLMDIQMPLMDGITATQILRGRYAPEHLPIVAMTANASSSDRERCKAVGMNDFVAKPVNPVQLWRALLACIRPRPGLGEEPAAAKMAAAQAPLDNTQALLFALASVEDLDLTVGLARTNNKPDFYLSMLRRFVATQAGTATQVVRALESNEVATAVRLAHTLKGLAGTLGALSVQAAAANLESLLGMPAEPGLIKSAIANMRSELDVLVNTLYGIPQLIVLVEPSAPPDLTDEERRATHVALHHLQDLLTQSNAGALDLWERQGNKWYAVLDKAAAVGEAIRGFDFDRALELLQRDTTSAA